MKRVLAAVLVTVMICLLFVGCASTESKLIGKWEREGDKVEFLDDGTGNISGEPVSWTMLNDNLLVNFMGSGTAMEFAVTIEGEDTLKLKSLANPDDVAEFQRVK